MTGYLIYQKNKYDNHTSIKIVCFLYTKEAANKYIKIGKCFKLKRKKINL